MKRKFRLRSSTDFERVRRSGKSYAHPLVVLVTTPNDLDHVRIGVGAGRSIGSAVKRNRAKRVLRSCADRWLGELRPGWDLIFLARKPFVDASFQDSSLAVEQVIKRAHLIEQ